MDGRPERRSAGRGEIASRWETIKRETHVLPSLLSADFANLDSEIAKISAAGAEILHLDVMDGHFVPNITFGPPVVAAVRAHTDLWLDAHLMVADPVAFLEPFAQAGANSVTIHVEAVSDLARCRDEADRLGVRLGIAIRPDTAVGKTLERSGDLFDLILVMTVMPGFGGQAYLPGSRERIEEAAAFASSAPRRPVIEVDGGIRPGTAAEAAGAGAEWLVAGNAIFRNALPEQAFRLLTAEIREARSRRM